MHNLSSRIVLISALILSVLFQLGCRKMASQNPIDTFQDGQFPKQLESLRSQIREISVKDREAILGRVAKDQTNPNLLKVAVIDSGVDIAHPDLLAQIDYRIENGRIVGAGFDLMGNAQSGTHVYVNPNLFAFSSQGLKNGKIIGVHQAPLDFLKKMENRLAELILSEMQKDPILMASQFRKINRKSIQFLQMAEVAKDAKDNLSAYNSNKEEGNLITDQSLNNRPENPEKRSVYRFLESDWTPMIGEIEIDLMFLTRIEHADRFINIVQSAFQVVDREYQYSNRIKQTIQFMKGGGEDVDESDVKKELELAFRFTQYGPDAFDPILQMKSYFSNIRDYAHLPFGLALETYVNELEQKFNALLKQKDLELKERNVLNRGIESLKFYRSMAKKIDDLEKNPEAYQKFRSDLRRYVHRTQHPFLLKESNGNSHGTHVAATIAKQNPNIRIVPIRVTTSNVVASKDRFEGVLTQLSSDFEQWLKTPLVQELILEIKKEYVGIQISEATIMRLFKSYFKKNEINAFFITEVLKAIEVVGFQNIKLANVSLGTNFEKNHKKLKRIDSFVIDLIAEFVRYRMGEIMQQKAPHTLFLIATGNDNAWFDGVTRSAFPVGIKSMRLQKISDEKRLAQAPNNIIQNVLGVASVNPTGSLTAFTNFSIQKDFPQIFSTGEEIMAAIPPKDLKAVESLFSKQTTTVDLAKTVASTIELTQLIDNGGSLDYVKRTEDEIKSKAMTSSVQALAQMLHFSSPITRQAMSGTSMATPTVTGVLADFIIKNAISTKKPLRTHFESSELSPEKLVSELMSMAQSGPYSKYMVVDIKTLVKDIKKWTASKGQIESEEAIKCLKVISK